MEAIHISQKDFEVWGGGIAVTKVNYPVDDMKQLASIYLQVGSRICDTLRVAIRQKLFPEIPEPQRAYWIVYFCESFTRDGKRWLDPNFDPTKQCDLHFVKLHS